MQLKNYSTSNSHVNSSWVERTCESGGWNRIKLVGLNKKGKVCKEKRHTQIRCAGEDQNVEHYRSMLK